MTPTTEPQNPRVFTPEAPAADVREIAEMKPSAIGGQPAVARETAVYPEDSVLEHYMRFARGFSESEDAVLIGAALPIVSRFRWRRVFIQFAGTKFPNLYAVLVTKPGFRKSTSIWLTEKLASVRCCRRRPS